MLLEKLCRTKVSQFKLRLSFGWPFRAGCEAGNMPFERPNETPEEAKEEVRCAYVALTRAKQRLYITHAAERIEFGIR